METNELIEHLREMGKHDDRNPNYYLLAADRLEDLQESVDIWMATFDMLNDRENRHHYLDYWREKNGESELTYPDGDQVYKDFFAVKAELAETKTRVIEAIKEYAKAAVDGGRESLDPVDDMVDLLNNILDVFDTEEQHGDS